MWFRLVILKAQICFWNIYVFCLTDMFCFCFFVLSVFSDFRHKYVLAKIRGVCVWSKGDHKRALS